MTTEEKIEEKKAFNVEEEFRKIQQELSELKNNIKYKDEIIERFEKKEKQMEESYKMLADSHQLIKNNMMPVVKENDEMYEYFKKTGADIEGIDENVLKYMYNLRNSN